VRKKKKIRIKSKNAGAPGERKCGAKRLQTVLRELCFSAKKQRTKTKKPNKKKILRGEDKHDPKNL